MRLGWKALTISVLGVALVATAIALATGRTAKTQNSGNIEAAKAAALAFTHGGRVTEVEVSKQGKGYEVDVVLDNGQEVEVQLDADFKVTGHEIEDEDDDDKGTVGDTDHDHDDHDHENEGPDDDDDDK